MKTAIQFGAGNIGRGFIGAVLAEAGYHVVFADVNRELLDLINRDRKYTVHIMDVKQRKMEITNISAVDSGSEEAVAAIADAELITTAVGVRILRFVAPVIAKGIAGRMASGNDTPLNVIACENAIRATSQLKELIYALLDRKTAEWADLHVGFADCSVDRIVPPVRNENPLDVTVENFYEWNVEEKSFIGDAPHIAGMNLADNLLAYIERKLFTLNTGHAITAYLGHLKGYRTIDESIADTDIYIAVKGAIQQSGDGLIRKFGFDHDAHYAYIEKIINRFRNPYLKDDVLRVGREPLRKLSADDRLILPIMTALGYGLPVDWLVTGAGAAMHFSSPDDMQSMEMRRMIEEHGAEKAISEFTGIEEGHPVIDQISGAYKALETYAPIGVANI